MPGRQRITDYETGQRLGQNVADLDNLSQLLCVVQQTVQLQKHGDEHLYRHLAGLVRVLSHQLAQHLAQVGAGRGEGILETDGADVEVDGGQFVTSAGLQDGNLVVWLAAAWSQADGVTVECLRLSCLVPISRHVAKMYDAMLTQIVTTCDTRRL